MNFDTAATLSFCFAVLCVVFFGKTAAAFDCKANNPHRFGSFELKQWGFLLFVYLLSVFCPVFRVLLLCTGFYTKAMIPTFSTGKLTGIRGVVCKECLF